jgi:hypothetical protein
MDSPKGSGSFSAPEPAVLLKAQVRRNTTNLFKQFLFMLEEMKREHDEAMDKLRSALPHQYKSYPDLADHYTETKLDTKRKKVLGWGNDTIRAIEEQCDQLDIRTK